jgi:hypothetical protein
MVAVWRLCALSFDRGDALKKLDRMIQAAKERCKDMPHNLSATFDSGDRGKHYEAEKHIQGGNHGNQHTKLAKRQIDGLPDKNDTAEKLADHYKVSDRTIERDAKVSKAIDRIGEVLTEAKNKVLSGDYGKLHGSKFIHFKF